MRKKTVYTIICGFILTGASLIHAQDERHAVVLNDKGMTVDSLYKMKYVEACSLFEQKKYNEAEKQIIEAEYHLSKQINEGNMYPPEEFYPDELACADLHCRILSATGKFKEAMAYSKKMNELHQVMHTNETRRLEREFNTEKEERDIEQLIISNANRLQTTSILIIAAVLFAGMMVLLSLWFNAVKKNTKRRSALIKAEKEEVELNLKIKEEQAIKTQLEKYEILTDFRLKEIELEGKNKAMEQLLKDKETLDKQIEEYTQKMIEYELNNEQQQEEQEQEKEENPTNLKFMEDVKKLINKKLSDKKEYLESLNRIDGQYIDTLRSLYNGNLSIPYIKYSVCFAIGMEIGEVSDCFSIEPSSVHMVRYRLKKKFGLQNNDDLDVFLRRLNKESIKP